MSLFIWMLHWDGLIKYNNDIYRASVMCPVLEPASHWDHHDPPKLMRVQLCREVSLGPTCHSWTVSCSAWLWPYPLLPSAAAMP